MPDSPDLEAPLVKRRLVYYISGFDPRGARFYHQLYRTEALRQQALDGWQYQVGARQRVAQQITAWTVEARQGDLAVETRYTFLAWDDLIRAHWGGSDWRVLAALPHFYWQLIVHGVLAQAWKCSPRGFGTLLTPLAALLVSLLAAALAGGLIGGGAQRLGLPPAVAIGSGALAAVLTLAAAARAAIALRLSWLARIELFLTRWGRTGPEPFAERWTSFADRIAHDLSTEPAGATFDEVLIVGHSVGAPVAVAVLACWLERHHSQSQHRARVRLLTLGQVCPMVGLVPQASWFREQVRAVGQSGVAWLDFTAPADALCFPLVDIFTVCGLPTPPASHYRVRSARFDRMFEPATYAALRRDHFRTHFQYLMATERPVFNSYFQLTAGARPLQTWISGAA